METTNQNQASVSYCNIDRLYYIRLNDEVIHTQQTKPTDQEIQTTLDSDHWNSRFEAMAKGERIRVSERIYFDMLGAVPPIKQTRTSFYCGECYSGRLYHFFEKVDGHYYGQLKSL